MIIKWGKWCLIPYGIQSALDLVSEDSNLFPVFFKVVLGPVYGIVLFEFSRNKQNAGVVIQKVQSQTEAEAFQFASSFFPDTSDL